MIVFVISIHWMLVFTHQRIYEMSHSFIPCSVFTFLPTHIRLYSFKMATKISVIFDLYKGPNTVAVD